MALTLYHALTSTCSQKARICLYEKDLPWESKVLNLAAKDQLSEEYLRLNPHGVVPTLVHDGEPMVDSSVICEYLDERFPSPSLSPREPLARARMRAWMRYFEEVATPAIRPPSYNAALLSRFQDMDDEQFRREQADVRPLRKHFYRRMGPKGFSEPDLQTSIEQLIATLDRMESTLERSAWLVSETYSIADIVILPTIDRMADLGLGDLWSRGERPRVANWYGRMLQRPAIRRAYPKGARLSDSLKVERITVPAACRKRVEDQHGLQR